MAETWSLLQQALVENSERMGDIQLDMDKQGGFANGRQSAEMQARERAEALIEKAAMIVLPYEEER